MPRKTSARRATHGGVAEWQRPTGLDAYLLHTREDKLNSDMGVELRRRILAKLAARGELPEAAK